MKFNLKTISFSALIFLGAANIFSQNRPVASTISARAEHEKTIKIEWKFPKKTDPQIIGVKLYRGTKPFSSYAEIEGTEPVIYFSGTQYADTVESGKEYFYAAIAVTRFGDYKIIIPGMNATVNGTRALIPASKAAQNNSKSTSIFETETADPRPFFKLTEEEILNDEDAMRATPLPFPKTILGLEYETRPMDSEAVKKVESLATIQTKPAEPFKAPYFFEEDMFSPDGGDDYTLFQALRSGLARKNYKESVKILSDFLTINRSRDVTNRAEFYLGESLYFCKDYENAIRCFLTVQDAYPELSKKWIDSSLDLLDIAELSQ